MGGTEQGIEIPERSEMYERSYGYKYEEAGKLTTVEIAKRIRADVKTAISEGLLPDRWKYSVTTHHGTSIDVKVKDCADAWMACPGYQVGTESTRGGGWTATGCRDPWCKAGGIHKDLPAAHEHDVLTEEALAAKMTLERIHGAYNHDGSEIQVDYFDVNYYGGVSFQTADSARWEAECKAEDAERKAETAAAAAAGTKRLKNYNPRTGDSTVHLATEVGGRIRLLCGAQLRGWGFPEITTDEITCTRCQRREEG